MLAAGSGGRALAECAPHAGPPSLTSISPLQLCTPTHCNTQMQSLLVVEIGLSARCVPTAALHAGALQQSRASNVTFGPSFPKVAKAMVLRRRGHVLVVLQYDINHQLLLDSFEMASAKFVHLSMMQRS